MLSMEVALRFPPGVRNNTDQHAVWMDWAGYFVPGKVMKRGCGAIRVMRKENGRAKAYPNVFILSYWKLPRRDVIQFVTWSGR